MSPPAAAFELLEAVERFCALQKRASVVRPTGLYHEALAQIHEMCSSVLRCELAGMERDAIVELLEPALNFPIAQQHRNRVQHQSVRILKTMTEKPHDSRILALACGGAPDFALITPLLSSLAGEVWFNDSDHDALEQTKRVVSDIASRCHFIHDNALKLVARAPGTFDLVLAGGLLDYLPDRAATFLLRTVYRRLLRDGGTFFLTNIARDNPFRCLIEYLGDWFLIERNESDILTLCAEARIPAEAVVQKRDETGLAVLIEITKY